MSRSKVILRRLNKRSRFRKVAGVLYVVIFGAYLLWRATIFSERDFVFSLTFYLAEIVSYLLCLVTIFCCWNYSHREPRKPKSGLKVDVFLPVYKEPLDMIRLTVMGAVRLEYPHRVLVLDDGKRDELKELAEEFGVIYIRRPDNVGAKAGNMNYALSVSDADYICVFDADHIAQPEALDAMLGFFEDENVGLVQTPQEYYNTDALPYLNGGKGRHWHDQSRFYNVEQACKDWSGNASGCGTGVVYRRSAVDAIGGFPELTVTEDMHSSLKMHQLGMKTVYLNEPVAYGVAAADSADYYRTRQRWAHGNLHAMNEDFSLFDKRLSWKQKFYYSALGIIYLECWQQLLMFLVPVISLCFGLQPFEITPLNVTMVLFFPLVMMVFLDEQGCGLNRIWTSQLFTIARMPIQMVSWSGIFGKKLAWNPSVKSVGGRLNFGLVAPQIGLFVLCLIGLIVGISKLHTDMPLGPVSAFVLSLFGFVPELDIDYGDQFSWDLFLVSGFWVTYNLGRTGFWIVDMYRRTLMTNDDFRFKIPTVFEFDNGDLCEVEWVSRSKLGMVSDGFEEGKVLNGKLWLPSGPLEVRLIWNEGYLNFEWEGNAVLDKLSAALYSVDWHSEMHERECYFPTFLEKFFGLFGFGDEEKVYTWKPALADIRGSRRYVVAGYVDGELEDLLGFGDHIEGEEVTLHFSNGDERVCQLGQECGMQGWCRKGLDGMSRWRSQIS